MSFTICFEEALGDDHPRLYSLSNVSHVKLMSFTIFFEEALGDDQTRTSSSLHLIKCFTCKINVINNLF